VLSLPRAALGSFAGPRSLRSIKFNLFFAFYAAKSFLINVRTLTHNSRRQGEGAWPQRTHKRNKGWGERIAPDFFVFEDCLLFLRSMRLSTLRLIYISRSDEFRSRPLILFEPQSLSGIREANALALERFDDLQVDGL
jgi:hypothetical protein